MLIQETKNGTHVGFGNEFSTFQSQKSPKINDTPKQQDVVLFAGRENCSDNSAEADSVMSASFRAVANDWLRTQTPQLKESSTAKYSNLIQSYLFPTFANTSIQSISRSQLLSFSRNLLQNGGKNGVGLSPKTVNSTMSVLKSIFKYASKEKGFIVADASDLFVRQPQKPLTILSRREQKILIHALCDELTPCNLGILLCLFTGMRIGEVCALKWGDINLIDGNIFVRKTMQRVQIRDELERCKKTQVVIHSPKSDCSIRKIPLPHELVELILPFQQQTDAFILTGSSEKYIEPRCLENLFKKIVKDSNISDVNFHVLRHTFATRCVELGFDLKSLSEILGHSNVNITLNRYVHPSMELKQENMSRLSMLLLA